MWLCCYLRDDQDWSIKNTSFIVTILKREFNLRAERRIIPYFQDLFFERNSSEKKYTMRWEDGRKAKTFEVKINAIVLILQGRTELCTLLHLCARISSNEKISRKLLIPFEGESKHTLSRLAAQRICETKILQVNLGKIRGVRDTLTWESGKKEVWTPNVVLFSELREPRVTYGSEDSGDLSGNREVRNERRS